MPHFCFLKHMFIYSRSGYILYWRLPIESSSSCDGLYQNHCCLYTAICFISSSTSLSIVLSRQASERVWLNRETLYEVHSFTDVYKHLLIRSPYSFFHFYTKCVYTIKEENVAIHSQITNLLLLEFKSLKFVLITAN